MEVFFEQLFWYGLPSSHFVSGFKKRFYPSTLQSCI
jgi:hypothetical protein